MTTNGKFKILHILSQVQLTGAEVYAISLADKQIQEGHTAIIVSGHLHKPTQAEYISIPIHKRSWKQRLMNIIQLRKIIKEHRIDVVHAHARAASWVGYFAVLGSKVPLISSVHGRQHLHTSVSLFDIYGSKVIAICNNIKEHLINEVKMKPEKITTIPNGFDFKSFGSPTLLPNNNQEQIISVIGRTNDKKGVRVAELLTQVFPTLLANLPSLQIKIIGGESTSMPASGIAQLQLLNEQFNNRIQWVGLVNNIPNWISSSQLVFGSGRVALETIYLNKPLFAIGEANVLGIITEDNIDEARNSNFGDIMPTVDEQHIDYSIHRSSILDFLKTDTLHQQQYSNKIDVDYSIERVSEQVMEVYKSARMIKLFPKFIPILMYHKIPTKPIESQHKIFVTKEQFKKHLRFFRFRNLYTLTFADYDAIREGYQLPKSNGKPIILTFDDGYKDNYENLLPLMKASNFRGVEYFLGDHTLEHNAWDTRNGEPVSHLMSTNEKQAFVDADWEIGAHSMTHAHLTELDIPSLAWEINQSKSELEQLFSTKIYSFAYPYGSVNEEVKKSLAKSGIKYGVATDSGGMHIENDLLQIFRINIFPNESYFSLYKKTSSWYRDYYKKKRGK